MTNIFFLTKYKNFTNDWAKIICFTGKKMVDNTVTVTLKNIYMCVSTSWECEMSRAKTRS